MASSLRSRATIVKGARVGNMKQKYRKLGFICQRRKIDPRSKRRRKRGRGKEVDETKERDRTRGEMGKVKSYFRRACSV